MDQVSAWRNESRVFFAAAMRDTIPSSVVDDHPDRITVRDIKRERTCVYDVVRTHTLQTCTKDLLLCSLALAPTASYSALSDQSRAPKVKIAMQHARGFTRFVNRIREAARERVERRCRDGARTLDKAQLLVSKLRRTGY